MASEKARCYVASPLGFTAAGKHYYREVVLPALAGVVSVVDPWALTDDSEIAAAAEAGELYSFAMTIGRRNERAIRSCSLLVANLDGQEPDSGTVAEVGFAAGLGITCFGWRKDLRRSGDLGCVVNLQVEYFINESGGRIEPSLDALVGTLRSKAPTGS